jgi:hypothetical protein
MSNEAKIIEEMKNTKDQTYVATASCGLGASSSWVAFYSVFYDIGVDMSSAINEFSNALEASKVWDCICLEGACIVFPPPSVVRRDNENRLHYDQGPALEWQDGYKQYFIRGVAFDEDDYYAIVNRTFRLEDLSELDGSDRQAAALNLLDPELLLKHVDATLINKGVKGTELYKVDNFMETGETEYCMVMTCPSTQRKFLEWVDPEVGKQGDADLAQASAWTEEDGTPLALEDYLTMEES